MQFEDFALKSNARAFASRSKAKAKPQRRTCSSLSTKTIPIGERTWTDIEPQDYSPTDYSMSEKLINHLRHGSLSRKDDGAIEFWKIKDYFQNPFIGLFEKWKSIMARGGGNKKIFQHCIDSSGEILYLRALQGHSGRNLIYPSLQDNVLIPDDSSSAFITLMCNQFTFHHQFRIDTGRSTFEQQTDSILSACESFG